MLHRVLAETHTNGHPEQGCAVQISAGDTERTFANNTEAFRPADIAHDRQHIITHEYETLLSGPRRPNACPRGPLEACASHLLLMQ